MSIATSCASQFLPCGYEGCLWGCANGSLAELQRTGDVLTQNAVFSFMERLFESLHLVRKQQTVLYYNGGPPGVVAYGEYESGSANGANSGIDRQGYDLPLHAYTDERFRFALVNSIECVLSCGDSLRSYHQ